MGYVISLITRLNSSLSLVDCLSLILKACLVIYDAGSQAEKLEAFLGNVECCRTNLEAGAAACPGPTLLLHYSCSGHYSCNARTMNISRPLVHFPRITVNITRTLLQQ